MPPNGGMISNTVSKDAYDPDSDRSGTVTRSDPLRTRIASVDPHGPLLIRTVTAIVHRPWMKTMSQPLTEAWAVIARLEKSCNTCTNESALNALDLMIDRQIDRIAANQAEPHDPAEARRGIATAARRERHRARLVRLYILNPALDERNQISTATPETTYAARQALTAILRQTSPQDAALLLSVGQGEAPQAPGLTPAAARKRLCRLRARFSHLNPHAA